MDDGADLTATIHTSRRDLLPGIAGGTEVTSTGVLRARNMAREGALAYPLLAVNDAATKHCSTTATAPASDPGRHPAGHQRAAGRQGPGGRRLRLVRPRAGHPGQGMGARVVVCEVDPLKALEAVMEGYQVLPVAEAARVGGSS